MANKPKTRVIYEGPLVTEVTKTPKGDLNFHMYKDIIIAIKPAKNSKRVRHYNLKKNGQ